MFHADEVVLVRLLVEAGTHDLLVSQIPASLPDAWGMNIQRKKE